MWPKILDARTQISIFLHKYESSSTQSRRFKKILQAKDILPNINRTQAAERAEKYRFSPWWPWLLTFDLDLQTRPSEGTNTSSVWIWRKSVQRFPRLSYRDKKVTDSTKQNLTQFTACGNDSLMTIPLLQTWLCSKRDGQTIERN